MKPTLYDIQHDPILSNVSIAYKNLDYVAEQILPLVPSKKKTGIYYVYDKSKFRKVPTLRGVGSASREVGYGLSKSTAYVCKDHALKQLVPDELKDQALQPLTPEIDAVENITERIMVEKEYDLATYMRNHANLTNYTTLASTTQWSDYANSDPISNVAAGIESIRSKIMKPGNVLLLGQEVYNKLIDHPDIIDRIKYSQIGIANEALLARVFNVQKVIIAGAIRESAVEGQSSSLAYIWGKYAWLLYVTPRPGVKQVSFGYHFQYKNRRVDKWYDKEREGTFARIHDHYTREIITVDAAYLIKDAVA